MQVNRPMKIRSGPYTEHDPAIPARSAVPPEDILYRINPRIRMRPESFGIIILTDGNKYVSVMPGAYALIQHLKKCGDFRIEDLKDTVETDEDFRCVMNELIRSHIIIRSPENRTSRKNAIIRSSSVFTDPVRRTGNDARKTCLCFS